MLQEPAQAAKADKVAEQLIANGIKAELQSPQACRQRYRTGKTSLYVIPTADGFTYVYDRTRARRACWPATRSMRFLPGMPRASKRQFLAEVQQASEDQTQRWQVGKANWETKDAITTEPGNRYIDFLFPGLMGGTRWVAVSGASASSIVDMRVRKLLKRLLATPMPRDIFFDVDHRLAHAVHATGMSAADLAWPLGV